MTMVKEKLVFLQAISEAQAGSLSAQDNRTVQSQSGEDSYF